MSVRVLPNKRLKLAARGRWNDTVFFSAPQLKREPLGGRRDGRLLTHPDHVLLCRP